MKITRKRIRTVDNYMSGIAVGADFYIGLLQNNNFIAQIRRAGFSANPNIGTQILPSIIGKVSKFNAEGGFIKHTHLPMVTDTRIGEITDWHNNSHTVTIPFQRYPRTPIPPPSIELRVVDNGNGMPIIVSPLLTYNAASHDDIKHIINLFLELFGECDTLLNNLIPAFNVPVIKLNWRVLPAGNYPWQVLQNNIQQIINSVPAKKQRFAQDRLQVISNHVPNFVATGEAGFNGYLVFGFPNKNFYILESIHSGNATYVLGNNWQQISQLSKQQILNQQLHLNRIIHDLAWVNNMNNLLV